MRREEMFANFKSVTGCKSDKEVEGYLEACSWDLAKAVDLYFSRGNGALASTKRRNGNGNAKAGSSRDPDVYMLSDDEVEEVPMKNKLTPPANQEEDFVRAPMNFSNGPIVHHSFEQEYSRRIPRKAPASVFEEFRDFKALAKAQSSALRNGQGPSTSADMPSTSSSKSLQNLFRPPLDITFDGNWEEAKMEACTRGMWILVNIQNLQEFACQTLNRDVWSNVGVKELVKGNFLFWQIYHDSVDGGRICGYYNIRSFPSIFVVDPRTGEQVYQVVLKSQDPVSLCDALTRFLDDFPDFLTRDKYLVGDAAPDNLDQPIPNGAQEPSGGDGGRRKRKQARGEEESDGKRSRTDDIDVDSILGEGTRGLSMVDGDEWRKHVAHSGDPIRVVLRFPDGTRHNVELTSDTKLEALMQFIRGRSLLPEDHTFVLSFPKREYSSEHCDSTLKKLGFSRNEMVHVDEK